MGQDDLSEAQWYALRVVPQKEYTVAYLLEKRGAWAYVPTGTKWRRRTRFAKISAEYAHPEMPGMMFVRFPSPPAWFNVLKNHLIIGPIGRGGSPWEFRPHDLHKYFARVPNGTLIIEKGEALVYVQGRKLRAPTTQTRYISKRKTGEVVEPTTQEEAILGALVSMPGIVLEAAA